MSLHYMAFTPIDDRSMIRCYIVRVNYYKLRGHNNEITVADL